MIYYSTVIAAILILSVFRKKISEVWPKYDIVKPEGLYLRRYFLWRSTYFNIYLHNIRLPDTDDDPHDHPWWFVSILLRGGYHEQSFGWDWYRSARENGPVIFRSRGIAYRNKHAVHKILAVRPNTWSLVITGPRKKGMSWGFLTKDGWVYWRERLLNLWDSKQCD